MIAAFTAAVLSACSGGRTGPAPVYQGGSTATSTPSAAPYPQVAARETRTNSGLAVRHIRPGDTLYSLSREHGVTVREIIEFNRLSAPYQIQPGQRLTMPRPSFHVVEPGDTLYGISRKYGINSVDLVRLNKIKPPYTLTTGQRVKLPAAGGEQTASLTPIAEPRLERAMRPPIRELRRDEGPADLPKPRARSKVGFLWPVRGALLEGFGKRAKGLHNDGINISAPRGAPVRATENGVVAYTGNELRGFGKLVMIKHAGGWMSAYAHNDVILVKPGQRVARGQTISRVGSTGSVDRPQLHFELRRGAKAVDPVKLLNWRTAGH